VEKKDISEGIVRCLWIKRLKQENVEMLTYQDDEQEHKEVLIITDDNNHEDPEFDTGTPLLNKPN